MSSLDMDLLKCVQKMKLIYTRLMYFSRYSFNYLHHKLKYFEVKWVEKMWLISGRLNFAFKLQKYEFNSDTSLKVKILINNIELTDN